MRRIVGLVVVLVVLAWAQAAQADSFDIDFMVGAGSVTGTIETDIASGFIADSNILDWTITLDDGTHTQTFVEGDGSAWNIIGDILFSDGLLLSLVFDASSTGIVDPTDSLTFGVLPGIQSWTFMAEDCSPRTPFVCSGNPTVADPTTRRVSIEHTGDSTSDDPETVEMFLADNSVDSGSDDPTVFLPTSLLTGERVAMQSVPEPSTLLLLGTGLAAVALRRRRQ